MAFQAWGVHYPRNMLKRLRIQRHLHALRLAGIDAAVSIALEASISELTAEINKNRKG